MERDQLRARRKCLGRGASLECEGAAMGPQTTRPDDKGQRAEKTVASRGSFANRVSSRRWTAKSGDYKKPSSYLFLSNYTEEPFLRSSKNMFSFCGMQTSELRHSGARDFGTEHCSCETRFFLQSSNKHDILFSRVGSRRRPSEIREETRCCFG